MRIAADFKQIENTVRIVQKGIKKREVRSHIEPDTVATIIICSLEGAIIMSN